MTTKNKINSLFVRDSYIRYINNVDSLIDYVKSNELKDVRRVFVESIARIEGLLILPGLFTFQIFEAYQSRQKPEDPEYFNKAKDREDLIVVDHLKWVKESSPWEGVKLDKVEDLKGEELLHKCVELQVQKLLNEFYFSPESKLYNVAEGLLFSSAVMTWTAVEYVAKDAWVKALNSRPKALAEMIERPSPERQIKINREFHLWELARHDFNMQSQMGILLSQKFKFSTVSGILNAFEEIFGINDALKKKLNNKNLRYLECLRHLIVHKGGIIDQEFIRRTKTDFQVGQKHPVTDLDVSNWLDIGFSAGEEILIQVENWLKENPE